MKISVISDTHGSLLGWQDSSFITSISDAIIHCGDIFNHGPGNPLPEKYNPKQLLGILNSLEKQLLIVKGNCDSEIDQKMLNFPISYPFFIYQIDKMKIFVTHGHLFTEEELFSLSKKWQLDILITGHTHQCKLERYPNCIWLNPGSPSIPKEVPSVALIDTDKQVIEIFNIKTKNIICSSPFL